MLMLRSKFFAFLAVVIYYVTHYLKSQLAQIPYATVTRPLQYGAKLLMDSIVELAVHAITYISAINHLYKYI